MSIKWNEYAELAMARVFRFLPLSWVRAIGGHLGARVGRNAIAARRKWVDRLHRNIERFSGIDSAEERERRIIDFTRRVGQIFAEVPVLHRMDVAGLVSLAGRENIPDMSKPLILASGHLSNWELVSHLVKHELGGEWCALYLPLDNKVRTQIACESRRRWIPDRVELIPANSPSSLRRIHRAIADGKNLLLFVDEEKHGFVWTPSLGRTIPYCGNRWFAARLAARYNLDILPSYVEPAAEGTYRVVVEPKLSPPLEGDTESKARWLADRLDECVDRWVRKWPEHWHLLPYLDLDKAPPEYSV